MSTRPKGDGGKGKTAPPAPVNKGKKNPAKDSGKTSVNPVEKDEESTGSDGNDTDALSHLPTDEESGTEDEGPDKIDEDAKEQ